MNVFRRILKKLVHNPMIDLTVGSILLISGFWETWSTLDVDLSSGKLHAGHGVLVLGFVTALRAVADMFAGLEFMDEAEYVEKKERKRRK